MANDLKNRQSHRKKEVAKQIMKDVKWLKGCNTTAMIHTISHCLFQSRIMYTPMNEARTHFYFNCKFNKNCGILLHKVYILFSTN